ncbi:hypothetical protein TIFTF001_012319 [Ficus carica]|uniref:Uncharacterized protein n=1 Tax=Ficus carica TaxID=3494 RepID=A0AA88A043_FICCA|nr:hypothetical protein TIFTF001_012319 [Ficus carica]
MQPQRSSDFPGKPPVREADYSHELHCNHLIWLPLLLLHLLRPLLLVGHQAPSTARPSSPLRHQDPYPEGDLALAVAPVACPDLVPHDLRRGSNVTSEIAISVGARGFVRPSELDCSRNGGARKASSP